MAYCPQCGVEVDQSLSACPLCDSGLQADPPALENRFPRQPELPEMPRMTHERLRGIIWNVVSVLLCTAMITVFCVDMFTDFTLTWSRYPLVSLAAAWCYISLCLSAYRSLLALHIGSLSITGIFLLALDLCNGRLDWFITLSLPLLIAFFVLAGLVILVHGLPTKSWALTIGTGLTSISLFCVVVNMLLNAFRDLSLIPTWALAVVIALLPLELLLFYVHYRVRKKVNLEKIFHL